MPAASTDRVRASLSPRWARWYRRVLPAYWIFLFAVTHFPGLRLTGIRNDDKVAHLCAFGLLAFLYWRFAESFGRPLSPRFVWITGLVLAAYAAVDEFLQLFVNRGADPTDWLFDSLGIAAVLALLEWRRRRGFAQSPHGR